MDLPFRIEKKNSFRVVGYKIETTNKKRAGKRAVPAQWENFKEEQLDETLMLMIDQEPHGIFGISVYNVDNEDARTFWHFIAVSSSVDVQEGMECYTVPEMTWAVFPCTIDTIGKTEGQAITKWLPKSDYRPLNSGYITGRMKSGAPDIEYYGNDGTVEIWVAVKHK